LVFQVHITDILGLKAVQSGSVSTDKFNAHIRALKGLGTTEQILFQWLDPASPWENGIISGAAMQVVGDYGFRHAKLCAGQSAGM